jgi:hypothetical protein
VSDTRAFKDHEWMRQKLGRAGIFAPTVGQKEYKPEDGWVPTGLTFASGTPRRDPVSLKLQEQASGTSIFDPVLCEVAYRWFSPQGGTVLDPFAGGSVRGIVASRLGRRYVGVDLREEQVEANRAQAQAICGDPQPVWIVGDSRQLEELAPGLAADFVFSCPPYGDLERYSDDPRDLSTLDYAEFLAAYREIVAKACAALLEDRFACFVVGDIRDEAGAYRGFVSDTIAAFRDAGLRLYNEAILVTSVGSLPIRAGRQFSSGRKLGKTHQNVLVFLKGDPKKATAACGEVEVAFPEGMEIEAEAEVEA